MKLIDEVGSTGKAVSKGGIENGGSKHLSKKGEGYVLCTVGLGVSSTFGSEGESRGDGCRIHLSFSI